MPISYMPVRYMVLIMVLIKSQFVWEMTPHRVVYPSSLFVYATATSYLKAACRFAQTLLKGFHCIFCNCPAEHQIKDTYVHYSQGVCPKFY